MEAHDSRLHCQVYFSVPAASHHQHSAFHCPLCRALLRESAFLRCHPSEAQRAALPLALTSSLVLYHISSISVCFTDFLQDEPKTQSAFARNKPGFHVFQHDRPPLLIPNRCEQMVCFQPVSAAFLAVSNAIISAAIPFCLSHSCPVSSLHCNIVHSAEAEGDGVS